MTGSYELVICQKCCKRRWPGLQAHTYMNFALLCTFLRCFLHCVSWKCLLIDFAFCSVIFYFLLIKQSPNEWRWFCGCLNYCILRCAWHVPCAILGWFIHCILWFLSLYVQCRCRLIFWTTFVLCLIVFEGQIPHFCKFCRAMVCLGATCSFFSIFSCNILLLFVLRAFYVGNFDCSNCFRGVIEEFLDFFVRFRVCIFLR